MASLTEELSTLLSASLELDRALGIMIEANQDEKIKEVLDSLHRRIHEGADFSVALASYPKIFSPTYINLIRAGEVGGNLPEVLARLSSYLNMMAALRDRVLSAMIYPLILVVVAALSLFGVLVFVLPEFDKLFADMGVPLPLLTEAVLASAKIFNQYWWILAVLLVAICGYLKYRYRDPHGRAQIDSWLLGLPLFGSFLKNWETASFARNLSVLTRQGVPMTQALAVAADAVSNRYIAENLHIAAGELQLGGTIAKRLHDTETLPRQAVQMIQIGEESGELATMLERIASLYDRKVRASIDRGLALLEPALILILGSVIAIIIFSILMAILGLNDAPI
ncbi:MAG: type II secretion system F family protein [Pseudomonadota bacterium]